MITVRNLRKTFKSVVAVDDLSFEVPDGSLFALLGTNGAGKTTTISIMTTLLAPDAGDVTLDGLDVRRDAHRIRERIGVVFQQSLLDPLLSARENLDLRARFYGVAPTRVDELVGLVGAAEFESRRYGVLSGGQKRRVDIARALLNRPTTLFLDEPTAGLDPASRDQVWSAIEHLRETLGLTVVLTTHYMAETEAADDVLVIDHGRTLAEGTPFALKAAHSVARLELSVPEADRDDVIDDIERLVPDSEWYEEGGALRVPVDSSRQALALLQAVGPRLDDFQFLQGSMDDVFLNLTTGCDEQREAA